MADCFDGAPIFDHTGKQRSVAWLRDRYGNSPQWAEHGWTLLRVWEQSQAMTCGIRFYDEQGVALVGYPVTIGWYDHSQPEVTKHKSEVENDKWIEFGWIDVPIEPGGYNPRTSSGGMFIKARDGSFSYTGIGWPHQTNHDHLNLDIRRGGGGGGPVIPPPIDPPTTGQPPVDERLALVRQDLTEARAIIDRALGRLQ